MEARFTCWLQLAFICAHCTSSAPNKERVLFVRATYQPTVLCAGMSANGDQTADCRGDDRAGRRKAHKLAFAPVKRGSLARLVGCHSLLRAVACQIKLAKAVALTSQFQLGLSGLLNCQRLIRHLTILYSAYRVKLISQGCF